MADFMNELWSSVFTPGTSPSLIIATNVTFAALQILLAALLAATYSVHFAILSVLCAGLWWSVNWFATELQAAQAKEEEAEKIRKKRKEESDWRSTGRVDDSADDEGEDTEVEDGKVGVGSTTSLAELEGDSTEAGSMKTDAQDAMKEPRVDRAGRRGVTSSGVQQQALGGPQMRQRVVEEGDRSGEISTDSEWEKVSDQGDR